MKKIFTIFFTILILTTNTSFAEINIAPVDTTVDYISACKKDLSKVDQDLHLIIKNIINCKYNNESIIKTLDFDRSLILSVYSNGSVNFKDNASKSKNREAATVMYIASLYSLSINALYLYFEDEGKNDAYLMDAIFHYHMGTSKLEEFNSGKI